MGLATPSHEVDASIADDVPERVRDLGRRCQDVLVVAIVETSAPAVHDAVEPARSPREKVAEAVAHRPAIIGLDDEVHVVVLHRELHDSKSGAMARALEGRGKRAEATLAA